MCGIAGGSAKKGKTLSTKKLTDLGIFNIQRGTDSCGYYYDGNIKKGIGAESNFGEFIVKHPLERGDLGGGICMIHTRKSTVGAHTEANAHPHVLDNYVQTHNGVIKNIWTLLPQYGFKCADIAVDSIGLQHLIKQEGFRILEEYTGFAALSMVFMDDPNSLYLYHGASKDKSTDKSLWIERPLFYLEQPEGIYYSSLEESLNYISENKNKAKSLPCNKVFRIVNGKFSDYEFKVSREEANVPKSYIPSVTTIPPSTSTTSTTTANNETTDKENSVSGVVGSSYRNDSGLSELLRESMPDTFLTQDIYYRHGRYYRGDNILLNGIYEINRKGEFLSNPTRDKTSPVAKYYFIRGAMVISKNAYEAFYKYHSETLNKLDGNLSFYLSKFTKYPISCLEDEGTEVADSLRKLWYKESKCFSGEYRPKFSTRHYRFVSGKFASVSSCNDEKCLLEKNYIKLFRIVDNTEQYFEHSTNMELIDLIKEWMRKPITSKDILSEIPEVFLQYLDAYCAKYYVDEKVSQSQLEADTSELLRDMIKTKQTFAQIIYAFNDDIYLKEEQILKEFKDFNITELLAEKENRYNYIEFDTDEDVCDITCGGSRGTIENAKEEGASGEKSDDEDQKKSKLPLVLKNNTTTTSNKLQLVDYGENFEENLVRENNAIMTIQYLETAMEQCRSLQNLSYALDVITPSRTASDSAFTIMQHTDNLMAELEIKLKEERRTYKNI